MATYTPNLRLAQPAAGETNWGDMVNFGITTMLEDALTRTALIQILDQDYVLSTQNGARDESRCMFIRTTGTLTQQRAVICPSVAKLFFVRNNCNFPVIFKTLSGSGVFVPVNEAMALQCDGANVNYAITSVPNASSTTDIQEASVVIVPAAYGYYFHKVVDAKMKKTSKFNAWLVPNNESDADDITDYRVIATPSEGFVTFCISGPGPLVGTFTINYLWS